MTLICVAILLAAVIFAVVFWLTDHQELALCILTVLGVIVLSYGSLIWYPRFECEQKVEPSGYECMWDYFAGCQIKVNGQWIPYDKWRVVE